MEEEEGEEEFIEKRKWGAIPNEVEPALEEEEEEEEESNLIDLMYFLNRVFSAFNLPFFASK